MTAKENIHAAALADLATRYPQTFVLEKYRPHRPLKVGIASDLLARRPELDRRKLGAALAAYTRRIMYLRGIVAGAARIDLDGNPAGEVTAGDAEYAAAKLAKTLVSREAAAVAAKGGERVVVTPAPSPAAIPPSPAPPAAKTLKRPVLRLPASRQKCG